MTMERAPPPPVSVLASIRDIGWNIDWLDEERVRDMASDPVQVREELQEDVLRLMAAERQVKIWNSESAEVMGGVSSVDGADLQFQTAGCGNRALATSMKVGTCLHGVRSCQKQACIGAYSKDAFVLRCISECDEGT